MSEATKERLTEVRVGSECYQVPANSKVLKELRKFRVRDTSESLTPAEVFGDLEKKYGKAGALIRGYRYRENLTQLQLAKKIKVTQGDLSKMEAGKRPVGKEVARRLAKVFKVDYRLFL